MGKVVKLVIDKDGMVRGATLITITPKGKPQSLSRPLSKLYPLEVRKKNDEEEGPENIAKMNENQDVRKEGEDREENERRNVRPRRAAAAEAIWRTRLVLDST